MTQHQTLPTVEIEKTYWSMTKIELGMLDYNGPNSGKWASFSILTWSQCLCLSPYLKFDALWVPSEDHICAMLVLLSPAKTLDESDWSSDSIKVNSNLAFEEETRLLTDRLSDLSLEELQKILGTSKDIARSFICLQGVFNELWDSASNETLKLELEFGGLPECVGPRRSISSRCILPHCTINSSS